MNAFDVIADARVALQSNWPINWPKVLTNLEAQIALDMGKWKQQCQIAMEAKSPEVLDALEPE